MSDLIRVQSVFKDYQQKTLVGKELTIHEVGVLEADLNFNPCLR